MDTEPVSSISLGLSNMPNSRRFALSIALMLLICAGMFRAQQKAKVPGNDWIELFNGKDLDGWTKVGAENWTVEDGLLHGRGLTKAYGYLETAKDYKDFQLSLRFKCVGDGNSGVFFIPASNRTRWIRPRVCSSRLTAR